MAETVKASSNFNNDDSDEEIYENIEAPKFVDFTRPDPPLPGDRSWFCLRVGCDQQHEEIDPDALYKSFRLRVLAARSPNLRLQKALSKRAQSTNMKCPLSAPPKHSKPRVSRLLITSISRSIANVKVKVHHPLKSSATPKVKAKDSSVAAKALTTPRCKRPILKNSDPFRSVRNPKISSSVPKNRLVAKTLVFNSPSKTEKKKGSLECKSPTTEICAGMKKLEISTQKKSRNHHPPLKHSERNAYNAATASSASKSIFSAQKPNVCKEASQELKRQNSKSLRSLKRKSFRKLPKCPVLEEVHNDSSDMEIDRKSRDGSFNICPASDGSRSYEGHGDLECMKNLQAGNDSSQEECIPSSETSLARENAEAVSTDVSSNGQSSTLSNSEREEEEKDPRESQTSNGNGDKINKESGNERKIMGDTSEAIEYGNKENAAASDDNRNPDPNKENAGRKFCESITHGNHQKVIKGLGKTCKGSSAAAASAFPGMKYKKKPKPTNPKPFRLRTDERGILREANLEKKHCVAPLKEITPLHDAKSEARLVKETIKKSNGQYRQENVTCQGNQRESDKRIQPVVLQSTRPAYLKMFKPVLDQRMTSTSPESQKKLEDKEDKGAVQNLENQRTNKSPLPKKLVRPLQRMSVTRKGTISLMSPSRSRLGVIKETTTASTPKDGMPEKNCSTLRNNAAAAIASSSRSSSQRRRRPTFPREPSFQKIHTPKSCTKISSANASRHNDS